MFVAFYNVESICRFTSNFVAICSATSYSFRFPSIRKCPPLDILKFIFNTFRNQDKKFIFIRVDKDGEIAISSKFVNTCHNMNIIVQNTGRDTYSLNGKSESSNETLDNITRVLLMNSIHKKELWCFSYHYSILIYLCNDNRLRGDVPYFLWN